MVAAIASTGAAVVSLVSALYTYGVIGRADSHQTIANFGAAWVGVRPAADTALSIGDTLHLAATITDRSGSVLVGAHPSWSTDDSRVATVLGDGSVVARGPGSTTVAVVVGGLAARARVVVSQRVAAVSVEATAFDSAVTVAEDARLPLHVVARDARGYVIGGITPRWHIDDTTVATIDSAGIIAGRSQGRSIVTAAVGAIDGHAAITVVATPAAIAAVAGTQQRALAGRPLAQAVVVRVTSRHGRPIQNQLVTFVCAGGQGTPSPDTSRTDADGRARTNWTLGSLPGRQVLLASVDHLDTAARVEAEADPSAHNTRVVPLVEHVGAEAGAVLGDSVGVRVTDSTGRALAGVPVTWTALDGSVRPLDARTDSLGLAHVRWTLGTSPGSQRVRAQVGAAESADPVAPLTIMAAARAGKPAAMAILAGDDQHAIVGATLPRTIVVMVTDAHGNRVPDVPLVLSPSSGAVPDTALRSDSAGIVRTRWTMGREAGRLTLALHVDGVARLIAVRARALPASPANLTFDDAPPAHGGHGVRRLAALVTDAYGNPVPDVPLHFTTHAGSVAPARGITDAHGRVSLAWTIAARTGELTLAGSAVGHDVKGTYMVHATATHTGAHAQR
ncbi:MAG TPA: Ig-like domain-containing protein [Gemmatimonadaceae bacterium]|nr:Ig-like domain-containing protein [Gemmatimonadaceae bacterium]